MNRSAALIIVEAEMVQSRGFTLVHERTLIPWTPDLETLFDAAEARDRFRSFNILRRAQAEWVRFFGRTEAFY